MSCKNIARLAVAREHHFAVARCNFGFHSNQKTQGQKHQVNNLYFKYQVCQIKLRHLSRGANEGKLTVSDFFYNHINDQIIIS